LTIKDKKTKLPDFTKNSGEIRCFLWYDIHAEGEKKKKEDFDYLHR
jgi:hypothetical protein